jgi:hypothetical protein
MQLIPVFDTSAIINLARLDDSDSVWRRVKHRLPARGCSLSFVTVIELFHGLSKSSDFDDSLKALKLAARLSRGKVLLQSIPFMHRELFGFRTAAHERGKEDLRRYLRIAQQPTFQTQCLSGAVTFLNKIEKLVAYTKNGNTSYIEQFLDSRSPDWRSTRQKSGSPLEDSVKEKVKSISLDAWKRDLARHFVPSSIKRTPEDVNVILHRCDAYLTFLIGIFRDIFTAGYRFDRNANDFHDGLQLLYLSRPLFCLVTDDGGVIRRTKQSSQSDRILTLEQFASRPLQGAMRNAARGCSENRNS